MRTPPPKPKLQTMTSEELAEHRANMRKLNPQARRSMPRMGFGELASALPVEESGEVDLYLEDQETIVNTKEAL